MRGFRLSGYDVPCASFGGSAIPIGEGLNGFAGVPQQTPAICNLPGIGSTPPDPVGIGPGTIARDHLCT